MSEIATTSILPHGLEATFDDGFPVSASDKLLPPGVDAMIYPAPFGKEGVRVEKNVNDLKKIRIYHEPYASHQAIFNQAHDAINAKRAELEGS